MAIKKAIILSFKITKNYMEDSTDIKWEDTVEFTFPIQGGRVIKVYDGDTITIASKLPFVESPLYRLSVRLNGIDTPEIKGKTEDEKTAAKPVVSAACKFVFLILMCLMLPLIPTTKTINRLLAST